MGRLLLVAVVLLVVLAAIVALSSNEANEAESEVLNTATVQRTDLVETETLNGTLGYGAAEPMVFQASSDGTFILKGIKQGFVTEFVDEGTVIESGMVLYDVNAEPVIVLNGTLPAYRAFSTGMSDGPDVEQLEQALSDLGFDPDNAMTIDEDFTASTADAIERLQKSVGAEDTGQLAIGDVIFAPLPAFVAEVFVEVSDQVQLGTPLLGTSRAPTGIVTRVAGDGVLVGQGEPLFAIDGDAVVLLIGEIPLYRTLTVGVTGDDVLQLQRILIELGHGQPFGMEADGSFDQATALAVAQWQIASEMQPDGVVNVGDLIVRPQPIRVNEMLIGPGDFVSSGTPVLTSSESSTYVTVELSTEDQDLVAVGDAVVVELPSGAREAAVVTEIGSVVLANQQGDTYFEMTVTLDDPSSAQGLDQAPVDVEVVGDSADDVLAVPVTALLALAEGGYAVEVVNEDGTTTLIAVSPGLFADGFVEVSSESLQSGVRVVIP
jgi:peptidoglycan hydrolase-like protein with peptidoglycan-binding domain